MTHLTKSEFNQLLAAVQLRNVLKAEELANSPVGKKFIVETEKEEHDACVAHMLTEYKKEYPTS